MDWWQIFYSFIGGFLGFGFALLTEALIQKNEDYKLRKELHSNLIDEVTSIADNLRNNENERSPIYFELPIWNSIISTGMLLSLLNDNKDIYDRIILIYNRVFALKEMEKDVDTNYIDVVNIRLEIINKIDDMMNLIYEGEKNGKTSIYSKRC